MKKISALILVLFLCSVYLIFPRIEFAEAQTRTIIVPNDYMTFNEALNHADQGDTILLKPGTYDGPINQTLIIDKTISIISKENAILNLHPLLLNTTLFYVPYLTYNTSLIIESNNITISGLTIKTPSPGAAISIIGNGTKIINCTMTSSLALVGSYSIVSESLLFNSISVKGANQTISQNTIFNGDLQITSLYSNIIGNKINDEINLKGSYNKISGNSFYRIFLEYSNSNIIQYNNFSCIWIGFYGHTSSNNTVSGNILDGGYIWGILMGDGSYNVFHDNLICNYTGSNSGYGIAIGGNHLVAEYNTFYRNTLINNNRHVSTNWEILGAGNFWDNGEVGNYWDDYSDPDSNGDGIGDVPYEVRGIKWDDNTGGHVEYVFGQDNFPLMEPVDIETIPEFSVWTIFPISVIVSLVLVFVRNKISKRE
ncbi:MAG: NosD domain-containing protein [Candidatus Bathyarchaeota archaeon]